MKVVIVTVALAGIAAAALQAPRVEHWAHKPAVRAVVTVEEIPTVVVEATRIRPDQAEPGRADSQNTKDGEEGRAHGNAEYAVH